MVQINFAQKSVNLKLVYYGPGMSGKTTNLEIIHQRAPEGNHGELTSISTDGDRTLFFDYMPLDLGTVAGMRTAFQLYTVPGQVYYNSTRKLVLQGVDGIIFVADSSAAMINQNLESLRNLEENLNEYGKSLSTLPHVIQLNKRDLPDAMPVDELARVLNPHNAPIFEAIANSGQGVFPTLKALAASVLKNIMNESGQKATFPGPSAAPQPAPAPRAPAPAGRHAPARPNAPHPQHAQPAPMPMAGPGFQPGFQQPHPASGGGFFAGPQAPAPMGGTPGHGQHAPGLQLAQPSHGMQSMPLNVAMPGNQARPQQRPNLGVQQAAPQRKAAAAPPARPQRAPAPPAAKPRQPAAKTKAAEPAKPARGKLTPVFIAVGAGVGAVLAWILMNVL